MGSGKRRHLRAVIDPTPRPYVPPQRSKCNEENFPLDLGTDEGGDTHVLQHAMRLWRGKVVHFSIEQQLVTSTGTTFKLVRIDTSEGYLHRHVFSIEDQKHGQKSHLSDIPAGGHDVVDTLYGEWCDRILDEWDENVRRWRRAC